MPAANIKINGSAASLFDAPIATQVNLDNVNVGGETTYLWEFVDQPDGAADTISNPAIQAPHFTPNKEGAYLIRLTVNQGGGVNERVDVKKVDVLDLKTRLPWPAAGETTQDGADGWKDEARGLNRTLRGLCGSVADGCAFVGINNIIGSLPVGSLVIPDARVTIKSGLPGEEVVLGLSAANATTPEVANALVAVVDSSVAGGTTFGSLLRCKVAGQAPSPITIPGGVTVVTMDPVFVSNTGTPSLSPGTYARRIGHVTTVDVGNARAYWAIEPSAAIGETRVMGPTAFDTFAAGWTKTSLGGHAYVWAAGAGGETDLVGYLPVSVGDIITGVTVTVDQVNNNSVTVALYSWDEISGTGTLRATGTSPAVTGFTTSFALALTHDASKAFDFVEVVSGSTYYLVVTAAAGAGARYFQHARVAVLPAGCKPGA